MSRTFLIIVIVGLVVVAAACIIGIAAYLLPVNVITDRPNGPVPTSIVTAIAPSTAVPTTVITVVASVTPGATSSPATNTPATAIPATAIAVLTTPVQYVMARTDVNIRSGPGTGYGAVGWVAGGQTARVTGVSSDSAWWRVICPDGSTGSCWVSANGQYTQPTGAPGNTPTAVPQACTDSAALIADITVPDGTRFAPNTGFNKIWRIRNTGTCTWDTNYTLVSAGGHLLGAMATAFPLPGAVRPGETVDLTINMVSPVAPDTYQSDWKLQNPAGRPFGVGRSGSPFWVKIVVTAAQPTTISGTVYQDINQNGVFDSGEPPVGGREVWLISGTACHVRSEAIATALSGGDGRYTFSGPYGGSYCIGLAGSGGLDDVVSVAVTAGQTLNNIHLHTAAPNGSISGWLWSDYCLTDAEGNALDGDCVMDGNGDYHGDGMLQPTESNIAGVTMQLQVGPCAGNNAVIVTAVTNAGGQYTFGNLGPGTYCVSMNAASAENAPLLLPGDWTFPARGIWYQEIGLRAGDNAYSVNFGWDYQLK